MVLIAARSFGSCQQRVMIVGHFGRGKWKGKGKLKKQQCYWQCHAKSKQQPLVKNQMAMKPPATYSSRMTTDIPLYESPGVPLLPFSSLLFTFLLRCVN